MNLDKTKEMIIDFRKKHNELFDLQINNNKIEQISIYKYLGVTINNKLSWSDNCQILYKKILQRLFCLRKLQLFHIDNTIVNIFYTATIGSLINFAITCWYGNATANMKHRIDRLIEKASRTTQTQLPSLEVLFNARCLSTVNKILQDPLHPLHHKYITSVRSGRLLSIIARTERFKNSFVPLSVRIHQTSYTKDNHKDN